MFPTWRKRTPIVLILALMLLVVMVTVTYAHGRRIRGPVTIEDTEFLGLVTFSTGDLYAETEIGGLSGITYDKRRGVYYALSDDRSQTNPARFYTVDIDVSDGSLDDGDVTFVGVTFLKDRWGNTFAERSIDPESIDMLRAGQLYISTEGDDLDPPIEPFISRFNRWGKQKWPLRIPDKFLYGDKTGNYVRDNLGFESLTSTPKGRYIYAAVENALVNDGPISTLTDQSPARFLEYRLGRGRPLREFVYVVDSIPNDPNPPGSFADHGLVEIQALDDHGTFLAMERSFAVGFGNTILLYETSIKGATDVSGLESIAGASFVPMVKTPVADIEVDFPIDPDNMEGMTFGPKLPDGRHLLILVSDNNFNPGQTTQFIALAVEIGPAP